ncbi:type II toxin-antitoxin system VapB family antitoxin [Geobacter argillaceus]|uniref:VapB protein of antitoxin of type II toxin-antitoxin system n=1 Tax=Geobacter argillaceus TaxID=345631 RepID=A0A562VNE4_9BACT|nr:type II toxin-antitoxin system VapB family antitoxin [Geobacter argillaceus]TWJ19513.1 VapB protein of antitoxin of type II toxin-antitoxin system [Geobacter argillaceus]
MRATLNIPDELISEVQRLSGQKSKTGAIVTVMEEYVRRRRMEDLLALRGKVQIDYDWQREEELEIAAAEERERYGNP